MIAFGIIIILVIIKTYHQTNITTKEHTLHSNNQHTVAAVTMVSMTQIHISIYIVVNATNLLRHKRPQQPVFWIVSFSVINDPPFII